ncbi:MAG: MCE family protein [Bacteroidales bacterium]|nr:MCE family protein [Bacteroidales bacterium]
MQNKTLNTVKLGIFVVSAILIFVLAIYYLGSKQHLFRTNFVIYTDFTTVKGLKTGNNVRFLGIDVGTVSAITIINDSLIRVRMTIDEDVKQFIKKDSKVEIDSEGLMGSKIITIFPGTMSARIVHDNDTLHSIETVNVEDILSELERTTGYTTRVASNLDEITRKINQGEGDLGRLINDNSLKNELDRSTREIHLLVQELRQVAGKFNTTENDMGRLLNSRDITERFAGIADNLDSAAIDAHRTTKELNKAAEEINYGNGTIHRLIYDTIFIQGIDTTLKNVNTGIGEVIETADAIRESWIINLFSKKEKNK